MVAAASAIFAGVQVITQVRSHQPMRVCTRAQHVADSCAAHPGTPQPSRIRGGDEMVALVDSARVSVCAHHTTRFSMARKYAGEETSRYLMASDLPWRTLDMVQAHTLRWLVEVLVPDWKSPEGGSQLTKPPGEEGACRRVILSLLVDHGLFCHPDQHAQLSHHLPAYTVGSLRATVQVACLVDVSQALVSSDAPQNQRHRFTQALREVFVVEHAKKHLAPRPLGRLEPTPYLKYRAAEVMRTMPALST